MISVLTELFSLIFSSIFFWSIFEQKIAILDFSWTFGSTRQKKISIGATQYAGNLNITNRVICYIESRPHPLLPFFFSFVHLRCFIYSDCKVKPQLLCFWGERSNCQKQKKAGVPGKTISNPPSKRKSKKKNNGKGWGKAFFLKVAKSCIWDAKKYHFQHHPQSRKAKITFFLVVLKILAFCGQRWRFFIHSWKSGPT